jgi:tetratricopeptide (TPR) repeat protein
LALTYKTILDRTVLWALGAILIISPLAVGAVEPWAYVTIETVSFALVAAWMAAGIAHPNELLDSRQARLIGAIVLPVFILVGLFAFQLVPLPPSVLGVISPSTYALYQKSLPGWPAHPLDGGVAAAKKSDLSQTVVLPTQQEASAGAPSPFKPAQRATQLPTIEAGEGVSAGISVWRTLSISPSLSETGLIKLICYLGIFLLVAVYRFESETSGSLGRRIAQWALLAGVLVATAAIIQRVYSNGRALWLFRPYDWRGANPWGDRAVGSFANPDHMANYLVEILPLAAIGMVWPSAISRRRAGAVRYCSIAAAALIGVALLLSSSRGGWIGAVVSIAVLAVLWPKNSYSRRLPAGARITATGGLALFFFVFVMLVGPGGRTQVDARLQQTVDDESLLERMTPALASLPIIADFPAFGIGLGCWPELYPRYLAPPWSGIFWNATHNDYVQLASEAGLVGLGLGLWFAWAIARQIRSRLGFLHPEAALMVAAAAAAASATAVHEFFDFSLQAPANALLLTMLLALAVRLTTEEAQRATALRSAAKLRLGCGVGLAAAGILLVIGLNQSWVPYPYRLRAPANRAQAYALVNDNPADANAHLALLRFLPPAQRAEELRAAVWLDPTDPFSRDRFAHTLLDDGSTAAALKQITISVADSPELENHFYLERRILPWLSPGERDAVEQGFSFAVAHDYAGAVDNFASYYDQLGDLKSEAALLETAARSASSGRRRANYLTRAGVAYANAGEPSVAEIAFRAAIAAAPSDAAAYERLIAYVFVPQKDYSAARNLISRGIEAGASGFALNLSLAQAAQVAGDYAQARAALEKALKLRPGSFAATMEMGRLEMAAKQPGRAAQWFTRASRLEPDSAESFFQLGLANESAYQYFAAEQAYLRALALAPKDEGMRQHYAAFRERVAQNSAPSH